MADIKKAILKKKVEETLYDLYVKTSEDMVVVGTDSTLQAELTKLNTAISEKATQSDITTAIDDLIGSAPDTYNTLEEIATWIQSHTTEFEGLKTLAGKEMTGASAEVDGAKGVVPAPTKEDVNKYLKGDGTWGTPPNTTYPKASDTQDGLMSKEDFTKLKGLTDVSSLTTDDIEEGETNKYVTTEEKAKLNSIPRIICDKTAPEDLTEADLFLEDLTEV